MNTQPKPLAEVGPPTDQAAPRERGEVREAARRLARQLDPPAASAGVRLDLGSIESVGSEELGALVMLNRKVRQAGGRLSLVDVRPRVAELLALTRLDTIFDVRRAER
jgi:anti-anti-sigma factor